MCVVDADGVVVVVICIVVVGTCLGVDVVDDGVVYVGVYVVVVIVVCIVIINSNNSITNDITIQ